MASGFLSDNGYEPYLLYLCEEGKNESHAVFLYKNKKNGNYGIIGNTPLYEECNSIEEIIRKMNEKYNFFHFDHYGIGSLKQRLSSSQYLYGDSTKGVSLSSFTRDKTIKLTEESSEKFLRTINWNLRAKLEWGLYKFKFYRKHISEASEIYKDDFDYFWRINIKNL